MNKNINKYIKIAIVNNSDIYGGAAKAAYRLHTGLLKSHINSRMFVLRKYSDDETVISPKNSFLSSKMRAYLDNLPLKRYKNNTSNNFSINWVPFSPIFKELKSFEPDIFHLHWIGGGMIKIEDIARIKAPIVWSLHDNWAFTGGCHIMWKCKKYKNNCGICPRLGSKKENDLSSKIFNRKQKIFTKIDNMTIVGLSKWLNECSKSSTLLRDKNHINLPNPIDTTIFKPLDKKKSRELWNLPKNKKLVLFGAYSATNDINKGFRELNDAMTKLEKDSNIEFVVFGSSKPKNAPDFGFKTHYLGHLHDNVSLVTLYSAVDVMIVPSLQENLSNVIMESLACGTPVVAFNIGGNSDMIDHKVNGYLAKPFDTKDLSNGIEWVLKNQDQNFLSQNAQQKVLNNFDESVVIPKYIKLYRKIINAK